MELLAAFGVGVKLLHQWSVQASDAESSSRFDRHFAGRCPAFFFVKAIPTFWARDA